MVTKPAVHYGEGEGSSGALLSMIVKKRTFVSSSGPQPVIRADLRHVKLVRPQETGSNSFLSDNFWNLINPFTNYLCVAVTSQTCNKIQTWKHCNAMFDDVRNELDTTARWMQFIPILGFPRVKIVFRLWRSDIWRSYVRWAAAVAGHKIVTRRRCVALLSVRPSIKPPEWISVSE